jgi:hypothetical protein
VVTERAWGAEREEGALAPTDMIIIEDPGGERNRLGWKPLSRNPLRAGNCISIAGRRWVRSSMTSA